MCDDCGCDQANAEHTHHHHHHGRSHDHDAPRTIRVERSILERNDAVAHDNRAWLAARRITAVNLISSPGSGKTLLLEKTLEAMSGRVRASVIVGDVQTDNDALRLRGKGAPVHQIETFGSCHLDAPRVAEALPKVAVDGPALLFIENVGNLVCPAAFDLGEAFKIALLSVTEGEDKPASYPALFTRAPVVVITKLDLAPHVPWDRAAARAAIRRVRPDAKIFELSARTGDGMDAWIDYLTELVESP